MNEPNNVKTETAGAVGSGTLLGARPLTADDVVKEADRAYDLGRKHGKEELADLLDWAETLLCNSLPMTHCTQEEWDEKIKSWRDQKHGVITPNDKAHAQPD